MDLDELKVKWMEYDDKLEASLRLNRQLLSESYLRRAKSALQRLILGLSLEAAATFVVIVALGSFLYTNRAVTRFAFPAIALDLCTIAIFIGLLQQVAAAAHIDYGKPIHGIQKQIEALRVKRLRYLQGIFLVAALAWTPLLIVAFEGFFGLDAYRLFGVAWLSANLVFGLAVIPTAFWLAKKFGNLFDRFPLLQQLRDGLAGHSLKAALGFLTTLSEFEHEK